MKDLDVIEYLEKAERMQWCLKDFDDDHTATAFANLFILSNSRQNLEMIMWSAGSFAKWGQAINDFWDSEQRGIMDQLEATFRMFDNIPYDSDVLSTVSNIINNEYAHYCFERLKDYVDEFYFDFLMEDLNDQP